MRRAGAKWLAALLVMSLAPVSMAPAAAFSHVPRTRGETLAQAKRAIRRARLRVGRITYTTRAAVRPGRVTGTRPHVAARVRRGSRVGITVARRARRRMAIAPVARPVQVLPPPHLPTVGVANVPGCLTGSDPSPYIRMYGAQILRVVVNPTWGAAGQALPCIRAAVADGVRFHLSIQYWTSWTITQQVAFFAQVLAYYGPYAWAVSVGNEQELGHHGLPQTPAQYAATWRATVPVIRSMDPPAILVAGEISPWGESFLKSAYADGLPGVQAIAAHAYWAPFCFSIPELEAWAAAHQLPLWFTEGLLGPDAWGAPGDKTLQQLAGAAVADAWLLG